MSIAGEKINGVDTEKEIETYYYDYNYKCSTAIERVKAEGIVDVFHTIKHMRTQRPHMVQTVVSTYILVHHFSLCGNDKSVIL